MTTRNHLGCTSPLEHSLGRDKLLCECYSASSRPLPLPIIVNTVCSKPRALHLFTLFLHACYFIDGERFPPSFHKQSQGTIISVMDQIMQSISGITHPTTAEKHQIKLTDNLILHMKLSHNCNRVSIQTLVSLDLDSHCIV